MRWRKLGRVFCPDGTLPWLHSHASLPVAVHLNGNVHRVFFSGRDAQKRSHVGFADLEVGNEIRIVGISENPVLGPGTTGTFDDSGVSIGSIVGTSGKDRLYYMGWNLGVTAPWRNAIGVALGDSKTARFARYALGPIMDRSPADPYTLTYPWVLRAGGTWHMWYGSNESWGQTFSELTHVIKHAVSEDGLEWRRDDGVAVALGASGTLVLTRPSVVKDADIFRMWYSHRSDAYSIGYAESQDGARWTRRDEDAALLPSDTGWDSRMTCYPCVFDHGGERYMLYNGDGYGESGFGIAILER